MADETDLCVWVRELSPKSFVVEINRKNSDAALALDTFELLAVAEGFARNVSRMIECDCYNSDTGARYV